MGERIRKANVTKLTGQDKDSAINKACKSKQGVHRPFPHGQAGVQPSTGKQGSITCSGDSENKCHCSDHSLPFSLFSMGHSFNTEAAIRRAL